MSVAGVAHLVERHLAMVEVASSSLVTRSIKKPDAIASGFFYRNGNEARTNQSNRPVDCWATGRAPSLPYDLPKANRQRASSPAP